MTISTLAIIKGHEDIYSRAGTAEKKERSLKRIESFIDSCEALDDSQKQLERDRSMRRIQIIDAISALQAIQNVEEVGLIAIVEHYKIIVSAYEWLVQSYKTGDIADEKISLDLSTSVLPYKYALLQKSKTPVPFVAFAEEYDALAMQFAEFEFADDRQYAACLDQAASLLAATLRRVSTEREEAIFAKVGRPEKNQQSRQQEKEYEFQKAQVRLLASNDVLANEAISVLTDHERARIYAKIAERYYLIALKFHQSSKADMRKVEKAFGQYTLFVDISRQLAGQKAPVVDLHASPEQFMQEDYAESFQKRYATCVGQLMRAFRVFFNPYRFLRATIEINSTANLFFANSNSQNMSTNMINELKRYLGHLSTLELLKFDKQFRTKSFKDFVNALSWSGSNPQHLDLPGNEEGGDVSKWLSTIYVLIENVTFSVQSVLSSRGVKTPDYPFTSPQEWRDDETPLMTDLVRMSLQEICKEVGSGELPILFTTKPQMSVEFGELIIHPPTPSSCFSI